VWTTDFGKHERRKRAKLRKAMKTAQDQTSPRAPASGAVFNLRFSILNLKFPVFLTLLVLSGSLPLPAQTATWTEITHPSSPAFAHHDMTYDNARHRLILAGRTTFSAGPFAVYAGAADGSWTPLPAPSPALPGTNDVELAYDSHRDRVVLYNPVGNKVWEFDGTNWTVLTTATMPIQCRDGAMLEYDPLRRQTVLVACTNKALPWLQQPSETWLWDGSDWRLAAGTNASPPVAAYGGMAFDAARGEMVLLTMDTMQTWTFNGTTWTQRSPATVPSPGLYAFFMAYDAASQRVVFYGGLGSKSPYSMPRDTWAWDGTDWSKLTAAVSPPANIDYGFAYFPERGGVVMHGGWGDPDWRFRTNVWLLTIQSAPQAAIRFTDIRLLGGQLSLTSTGRVQTGASQVLQASTNLPLTNAWAGVQTNPAPAATNLWTVPLQGPARFFRLREQP
jgi:hypothetical protein